MPEPVYEPLDMFGITPVDPNEIPDFWKSPHVVVNNDLAYPGKLGKEIRDLYTKRGLLGIIFWGVTYATTYGAYQFTDDGSIEYASNRNKSRNQFLYEYFIQRCPQAEEGCTYMVEIPNWTSVWKTIPKNNIDGFPGFDFIMLGDEPANVGVGVFDTSSYWLGGMWDFQVKGVYLIRVSPHPQKPDFKCVDVRPQLTWRWVDRIDANSWWGYNWEKNDTQAGILEGLVDLVGDKRLGASFDIHVNFEDSTIYELQIGPDKAVVSRQ